MSAAIQPERTRSESGLIWSLFVYSFLIATSYLVIRTAGDSLFLSQIGNQSLPLVFLLASLFTGLMAWGWYSATRMLSVGRSVQWSSTIFAILTLIAWQGLPHFPNSFSWLAGIYLLAEIKGCINAINIVSAMNVYLPKQGRRRALTTIGLAAPASAVLMGTVLAAESMTLDLRDWLLVSAGIDLLALAASFVMTRQANTVFNQTVNGTTDSSNLQTDAFKSESSSQLEQGQRNSACDIPHSKNSLVDHDTGPQSESPSGKPDNVHWRSLQFWLGILIATKVIILTIISFEFKAVANTYFKGDSASLVCFFGTFHGAIGLATILIQLFLTGRILANRNYQLPVLFMPGVLMLVSVSLLLSPTVFVVLVAATAGKSLDAWRRSVHDTTLNDLYAQIKLGHRRFTIALNGGLIKPMSEVVAASIIFFLAEPVYRPLLLLLVVFWVFAGLRLIELASPVRRKSRMLSRSFREPAKSR